MPRIKSLLAIAGSCCLLWFASGCELEQPVENKGDAHDAKEENPFSAPPMVDPGMPSAIVTPPVVIDEPVEVDVPVPVPVPGPNAGGGGSQGAEEPYWNGGDDREVRIDPEDLCDDHFDNNGNGFVDCADPACVGKPCSDNDGCTVDDVCRNSECVGRPRDCAFEVGNECTLDTCVPVDNSNTSYQCVSVIDPSKESFGSCTPSSNCLDNARYPDGTCIVPEDLCVVGECVQSPDVGIICLASNLDVIPADEGGCNDGNVCTADLCAGGECFNSILDGVYCDVGSLCTIGDVCVEGVCTPGTPTPDFCIANTDCVLGTTCTSIPGVCILTSGSPSAASAEGDPCFIDATCGAGLVCYGALLGPCSCDTGSACTTDDVCIDGACTGTPITGSCDTGTPCLAGDCVDGACVATGPEDDGSECNDGISCTVGDECEAGDCVGTPDNALCNSGNVCLDCICSVAADGCSCSQISGPSDETCPLALTSVGLSATINAALALLGVDLSSCYIGVEACINGNVGACQLSAVFADACTAASLDDACDTNVFELPPNLILSAEVCAGLKALVP